MGQTWIVVLQSSLILGIVVGVAITVKRVLKSVEQESSKIQALLSEIKERLGK